MSASRPFAIVTGASTGIGFELAKRCAKEGYDLLIAADEPGIEKWRVRSVGEGRKSRPSRPTLQPRKVSTSFMQPRRDARSIPFGECRAWSRPCLSRPGFCKSAAGRRYQYHRHGLSDL